MNRKDFKVTTYTRLTTLTIKRLEAIKLAVTELSAIQTPLSQVQLRTLSSYSTEIKRKCADFEVNLQRVLDVATAEELDDDTLSKHQDAISNLRASLCAAIEVLIPPPDPQTPSAVSEASHTSHSQPTQVRLPKLDLQQFSGDLSSWTAFINLFDTTIHRNASLSAVLKFQYLLSVLQSEPLNLIKGLALTTANYTVAYNLLRERYHNPRRLTSIHLNQLLDLPNISSSSMKGLRQFVNVFTEHSQALKALDCDVTSESNPLLSAMILRKMDNDLRKRLESHRSAHAEIDTAHSLPEVKDIISFLNTECVQVEDASYHNTPHVNKPQYSSNSRNTAPQQKKVTFSNRDVAMVTTQINPSHSPNSAAGCFSCKQTGHKVYSCPGFKEKSPQERFTLVKKSGRCVSCLGPHELKNCQSKATCQKCQKRHHSLLHFTISKQESPQSSSKPSTNGQVDLSLQQDATPTSVAMLSQQGSPPLTSERGSTVLLGTALVKLKTVEGNTHVFRALLDSGSMCDLISENAAQLLHTHRYKSDVKLCGLSQNMTNNKGQVFVDIETLSGVVLAHHQPMVVLEKLTVDLPRVLISPEVLRRTNRYILADPTFHLPGPIDVVIGGALFAQLLTHSHFSLGQQMPQVVGTHFGYVVMGSAPCAFTSPPASANINVTLLSSSDADLHTSLQRFWQQEEPPTYLKQTAEKEKCDHHFKTTHFRREDGHYVIELPFKEDTHVLGSSYLTAERRFHSLESKFCRSPDLKALYSKAITEHMEQGHIVKLEQPVFDSPHYFLPHHGVLKENSSSTKLRIVYDASCRTSSGHSLNDVLMTGRKLQTNIFDIMLHFRCHKVVFTCDIRQMYLQIYLKPSHQAFQLVLWRDNQTDPISTYKLTRVTFGVNSSPYQAIKTLHQLADDEGHAFPAAAQVLRSQTYVDDIITGADTEEDAIILQDQLTSLLSKGGFELRKWVSNSPSILQRLPEGHLESPVFLRESNQPHFSVLGLHWSPSTDCFTYSLNLPVEQCPTKRSVLSVIAKIYDPCGFLAPFIMLAKCFMQFLWTTGLSWDEPLHPQHAEKWKNFVTDTRQLAKISIPRPFEFTYSHDIECHGFSDASENGFSAIIYFRCQLTNSKVVIRPVAAKTRVAPLKRVTIPRLELCAAHLLAQLVSHCQSVLNERVGNNKMKIYLWSDSSVVLTWLRTAPYRLKTYVANRVAQTQELVPPDAWRHVSTNDNPADCASRGIPASQLVNHPLWWTGPPWLQLPHHEWPVPDFTPVDLESSEELKPTPLTVASRYETRRVVSSHTLFIVGSTTSHHGVDSSLRRQLPLQGTSQWTYLAQGTQCC